jgi:hypothetical protein
MNSPFCLLLLFRGIKGDDGLMALETFGRISEYAKMVYLCRRNIIVGQRQGNGRMICCALLA